MTSPNSILLVRVVEEMKRGFYEFANSSGIQSLFMYQFILTVECLQWKIVNAALFTSCTLRIHICSRPAIFLRHRKISIRWKIWLVQKTLAILSTNQTQNSGQSRLVHSCFQRIKHFSCFRVEFPLANFHEKPCSDWSLE